MTFVATSGATRAELAELVLAQNFNPARYADKVNRWLNDGVLEVCKRLGVVRAAAICAFDATGVVTQPATPFFKVNEVWIVDSGASGTTEAAIAAAARWRLAPLPTDHVALTGRAVQPAFYTAQRGGAATGRHVPLQITVGTSAPGRVGIVGLQRPAVMDEDTDVTGLGADLDEAVVAWATSRAYRQEGDVDVARYWRDEEFTLALRSGVDVGVADGPIVTPGLEDC